MAKISIVIPTFNSRKFIASCLDYVFNQEYRDFEVVVVDNGSTDGTVSLISQSYPQVTLLQNSANLGASRARNQGIEIACGEWVLSLDCDVTLKKNFLLKFVAILSSLDPEIGIIQPKILDLTRETIYSCGIALSWLRRFFDIGKGKGDHGQFNQAKFVFGACSACAFYRQSMLSQLKEDTGWFDERFFFLVEDVDLSWRAQRKGWKALFVPELVSYHYGNSSGTTQQQRQCLSFRNRYYSIKKNEGLRNYSKKFIPLLVYDLPRFFYLFLTNRETIKQ